jgi:hypothetical protein
MVDFDDHICCDAAFPFWKKMVPYALYGPMTDNQNPFAELGLERAIALRWALRDIKAKRLKLSPVSEGDLATLAHLGLVEMQNDDPVLTHSGHTALNE